MDILHTILVDLHSINRWIVLLFGLITLVSAGRGWLAKHTWQQSDQRYPKLFIIFLDIQLLLGLLLYFVFSPITTNGFEYVFGNPASRFFLLEHSIMMLLAVIIAHIGTSRVRKAKAENKFKRAFVFYGFSLLLILVSIPWPFMPGYGRPWLF